MGWRTHYFGTEHPSRGRRLANHAVVVVLALSVYGYWNNFVPEGWLLEWGVYAAAVLAVAFTGWLVWRSLAGRHPGRAGDPAAMVVMAPLSLVFVGGFAWVALVHGAAGAYTRLFGAAHTEVATLRLDYQRTRKECHYQAVGDRMDIALPGHLCISSSYYDAFPGHLVEMELQGQSSVFGFNVSSMQHRADLGLARR